MENIKMQKYSSYKDSRVEWLGEIPSHWDEIKLKINSKIYNGDSLNENKKAKYESDDETHLAYISSKDIDLDTSVISYENGLRIPINEQKYKVAMSNSSLICIEGGSAGRKIAFTNQDVCFVNKLACISAKNNTNSKFLYYTLKGSLFQTQFKLAMSGMIGGVAISNINNFYILAPTIEEQITIAAFLDRKAALIDQAIDIKQKQIELLKERRQILIHKAVTSGLNPNVKLKDSGVEWIGGIPEGWEVARVKQYSNKISKGTTPSTEGRNILDEGPIRYIKAENIQDGFITNSPAHFIDEKTNAIIQRSQLQENDILFVIAGATLGKIAIVSKEQTPSNTNQAVAFVRPNPKVIPRYLAAWLSSSIIKELTWLVAVQSAQPNLSMENLGNFPVVLPSLEEQENILIHIDNGSAKIATAISLKEQEIEKLKEYKATLINSAVTGKIKVC